MKKLFMVIVCLMTMVINVDAQVNMLKIKQVALNKFKMGLIAPSQFILTDIYGNKIGINKIIVKKEYVDNKDIYVVLIVGDARNRTGGFEQVIEKIYVTSDYIPSKYKPLSKKQQAALDKAKHQRDSIDKVYCDSIKNRFQDCGLKRLKKMEEQSNEIYNIFTGHW